MLLETLDTGKNDIIIYSQNVFSAENNFRIIFKDDTKSAAKKISFADVCMFVNDTTPKNIIIYRLLINTQDLGMERSKYGFSMIIDDEPEVIFFDPIYAVKEIENMVERINNFELRFRIQQVGLTSSAVINGKPSFTEVYSVDLTSKEAQFQNDKVFVDALYSVKKDIKQNTKETNAENKEVIKRATGIGPALFDEPIPNIGREIPKSEDVSPAKENIKIIKHAITEDKSYDYHSVFRMTMPGNSAEEPQGKKEDTAVKKDHSSLSSFINSKKQANVKSENTSVNMIEIFKSSSSLKDYRDGKGDQKIVLKMNK